MRNREETASEETASEEVASEEKASKKAFNDRLTHAAALRNEMSKEERFSIDRKPGDWHNNHREIINDIIDALMSPGEIRRGQAVGLDPDEMSNAVDYLRKAEIALRRAGTSEESGTVARKAQE